MGYISALKKYRGFILGSVKREFQMRYQRSMLGAAWLVLQPLSMILVYTLVFSKVMHSRLPGASGVFSYSIYLCAGVLTWGLFAEILGRCQNVFIENANMLKKLSFPKICLPIIIVISALLNFAIIFSLFLVFLLATGNFPGLLFFAMFPVLITQVLLVTGLGLILGVLNVFFRDIGQIVNIALQFLFWFTPIVYAINIVPVWAYKFFMLNPMARITVSYQDIFVGYRMPNWHSLFPVFILALILCFLAAYMLRKHSADMVDEL